jgi:hypothetical protein
MARFAIERIVAVPSPQVWDVITDWAGYSRWTALTTMRLDRAPTRVGCWFAGLTGVGGCASLTPGSSRGGLAGVRRDLGRFDWSRWGVCWPDGHR